MLLARFRRHYQDPGLYRSPAYATRDQVIPFGVFWIYWNAMPGTLAEERLSEARAIGHALALAFGKANAPLPKSVVEDQRAARGE